MRGYPDNERDWNVGDLVIHKADAKKPFMLMCVVRIQKNGMTVTRYILPGLIWDRRQNIPFRRMPRHAKEHYGKTWKNPKSELLDPADFGIEMPETFERYWE